MSRKRLIFRGNKAKKRFRINHLIQKPHKNKPNFRAFAHPFALCTTIQTHASRSEKTICLAARSRAR